MPEPPVLAQAQSRTVALLARLYRLERASAGALRLVRTVRELEHCLANGIFAAIFYLEGSEAIDPEFELLEVLYGAAPAGTRLESPGPLRHGRPLQDSEFSRRPPDVGPGLTDLGRELVTRGNDLGVLSFFRRWTALRRWTT